MILMQIPATTEAVTTNPFRVKAGDVVSVVATGLADSEEVQIQVSPDGGTSFVNVEGADSRLHSSQMQTTIRSGGLFRLVKTATAALSGATAG